MRQVHDREIIYVGDPMCSWCYGFSSTITRMRDEFQDRAPTRLVMGGFRPDGTHLVTASYSEFLRGHWTEIGARTGQKFSFGILEKTGWIYNTERPCRAVVAMRELDESKTWHFLYAVQRAFYFDNHDSNDENSYAAVAERFGIDRAKFLTCYQSDTTRKLTEREFQFARYLGVDSFPTVVGRDGNDYFLITKGYRPIEDLRPFLNRWLGPSAS